MTEEQKDVEKMLLEAVSKTSSAAVSNEGRIVALDNYLRFSQAVLNLTNAAR